MASEPLEIDSKERLLEVARWYLLVALDAGRPYPMHDDTLWRALCDSSLRLTMLEMRRELAYLADRKLVEVSGMFSDRWEAKLTALGVDVVSYTVECRPGIGRPPKR